MPFSPIFKDPNMHYYLRMNPKWYKRISDNPQRINEFMNEYKVATGQTVENKINRFSNQVNFITNMVKYLNK